MGHNGSGGVTVTTGGTNTPQQLSDLKGLRRGNPADVPYQITIRRSPSDTAGGYILVGPDKDACVHQMEAGAWYWEYYTDPADICINDQGISGALLSFTWGGKKPEEK